MSNSSSLKKLDQFSPDFIWGLLSKGYCQFVQNFKWLCTIGTRWPPCPYMVKNTSCSPEPRKLLDWILVYSIGDARSTKFIQMMILEWSVTFYSMVKFLSWLVRRYWKNFAWHLFYICGDARFTKYIQMMILEWSLTFYSMVKFLSWLV